MKPLGFNCYYLHTSGFDKNEYYIVHNFKVFCVRAPLNALIKNGLPLHLAAHLSSIYYNFTYHQVDINDDKFKRASEVFTEVLKEYNKYRHALGARGLIRDIRFKNSIPLNATSDQFMQALWDDAWQKMAR